jgi:3-oxoacyl-[acyl-carrier-protein] synthase-3
METSKRLFAHPASPIRSPGEASHVLIHTGSQKILDGICGRFEISPNDERVAPSYRVLAQYGNLTGASLGFMIAEALREKAPGHWLLVSFGLSFSGSAGVLTVN